MARAPIRKAVIPAAGLGTRFLPATKAVAKELLPIVDTPTIQYIVAEAVAAGVRDVIIVNAKGKETIVDHFDVAKELEAHLAKTGKIALRDEIRAIAKMANVVSIRQQEPLGLGHAVLCAKDLVGDEPFVVMLGDDIIDAAVPGAKQLADCWARHGVGTIALMEVPREETSSYGVAAGTPLDDRTIRIDRMVEKPKKDPPSNLAVIGRYVLTNRIFEMLGQVTPGAGGEIQLTDGISALLAQERALAVRLPGRRFDCGSKLGYLQATVEYGVRHAEIGPEFTKYLKNR
jgi:UTP--glucose-1-phosphate uridylyltransferase